MKVHEYQAKQLLKQYGVPVPEGQVAGTPEEVRTVAAELNRRVVIKGQVHSGGRGKAGAVKLAADPNEAEAIGKDLLGKTLFFAQANSDLKINNLLGGRSGQHRQRDLCGHHAGPGAAAGCFDCLDAGRHGH